jgi:hypothetical protein
MEIGLGDLSGTNIIVLILTAGAIYGAIRQDIKNIHEKIGSTNERVNDVEDTANDAHKRIDAILIREKK